MAITVLRDLMVPMRDGVCLAIDLYLPGEGAWAALLERTPYNKRGTNHGDRSVAAPIARCKPDIAAEFARAGYAYVLQDCRGRYGSQGVFTKYVNEAEDGVDTLDWIRAQPWCNGQVATLGLSYGAHAQTALAAFAPPGLAAMFIDSGGFSSAYHSGIRQGGAFELKQLTWAYKHALLAPATAADPQRRAALEAQDIRAWIGVTPWRSGHSPVSAAPEYEDFVLEQWRHECFDGYWTKPALYARGRYDQFADVPMVHMSSWYDPYALTATQNYVELARRKRGPVKLVMGPWTHGERSVRHAGEVDFGPRATLDGNIAPDYISLRRAWFDRHVRALAAPDYLPAPVRLFVMGGGSGRRNADGRIEHGGRWRDEADWPLARAVPLRFYLHADGSLDGRPPEQAQAALGYASDPLNPVPTKGGAIASGAPVMEAGAFDQGPPGMRDDVLSFLTAPLESELEVTGPVTARLFVASSALDTDFTIKLMDVYPDGCAINLTHGILRMRFRDSFERPTLMQPETIYQIDIQAFPTSNLFGAGHRIRLDVASSNFPHFDINPNTGAPAGQACTPVLAHNRVFMDAAHGSFVLLPVVA